MAVNLEYVRGDVRSWSQAQASRGENLALLPIRVGRESQPA